MLLYSQREVIIGAILDKSGSKYLNIPDYDI
jgi:hypothetical protein